MEKVAKRRVRRSRQRYTLEAERRVIGVVAHAGPAGWVWKMGESMCVEEKGQYMQCGKVGKLDRKDGDANGCRLSIQEGKVINFQHVKCLAWEDDGAVKE